MICVATQPAIDTVKPYGGHNEMLQSNQIMQSLWIGSTLSVMEQLCMGSFLTHGHDFHLYTYAPIDNVPTGVTVQNANDILPESMVFRYRDHHSYAGFANFFRYKLLLERGGWWVDTDAICLKPFDFVDDHVFASERLPDGQHIPTNPFIKAPRGSEVMAYAWEVCQSKNPHEIKWDETGAHLLKVAIEKFSCQAYLQPYEVFCPLDTWDWKNLLDPAFLWDFPDHTRAIHLWNELWRRSDQDKNVPYPETCLYERLKKRYLVK